MNPKIKSIVYNAFIAALYVILTLLSYPLSFGQIQIRFAEMLVLLCFFRKDYIFGLTIGCAVANLFSTLGMVDVLFGTLATLISCLLIMWCRHLVVAVLIPVIANGFIVAFELYQFLALPYWISAMWVSLGELGVMAIAYIFFMFLRKRKRFFESIRATQNIGFKF